MKIRPAQYHFCYAVWIPALALVAIGLLFVYSASSGYRTNYMPRQLVWVIIGLCIAVPVSLIPFREYHNYAAPIYVLSIALLIAVLLFGVERNNARSWLGIGTLGIQPSEFTKIAVILIFGRYLEDFEEHRYDIRYYFMSFILLFIPLMLILLQPDMGTALIFLPVVISMFYITGTRKSLIATTFLGIIASFPLLWHFVLKEHHKVRITLTWNPEIDPTGFGWQGVQSKIAIGSGELAGRGFMQSVQSRLNFLPERHTDFIYSVVGEEWGFLGCMLVLFLFIALIFGALFVARRAKNVFGEAVATGIAAMFATQVIMNIGMAVCLLPIIGIPLPLLSYGGSSMLTVMIALGLLQSIYGYSKN